MNVQQVERVELGDFRHARGQRQVIRRIVKQRVVRYLDFVEEDVRHIVIQTERLRIGDEVDFVSALRELNAELGRDNTTAAVSGVTGDPDLHKRDWLFY